MFILYTKTDCPFCTKALAFMHENSIAFEERNYLEDEKYLEEIITRGGKRQVPFLVDEENDVSMYESDDIIAYVGKQLKVKSS